MARQAEGESQFRIVARSLYAISEWHLAAITMSRFVQSASAPFTGFLGQVVEALREKQPLPPAPSPLPKAEAVGALRLLVEAVPLRVGLQDMLESGAQVLAAAAGDKPLATVVLVFSCQELHALAEPRVERAADQALMEHLLDDMMRAREECSPPESLVEWRGPSKLEDRAIGLPAGKVLPEFVHRALEGITWPPCFSRPNVKPDGALYFSVFPMGMVNNYHRGLLCSRTLQIWPPGEGLTTFMHEQEPEFKYTTVQLIGTMPRRCTSMETTTAPHVS